MSRLGVNEKNLEGKIVREFAKIKEKAVVNTYFQKRQEHSSGLHF